jgi:hypothetical protein
MISDLSELDFTDEEYPSNMPDTAQTRDIAPVRPTDPSMIGYPPTLLVELALRSNPLNEILDGYNIGEVEWDIIRQDPAFIQDLARTCDSLKEEGTGFKMKAKLQAEALLKTSWDLIHNAGTPPSVKADLIKSTVKWSGYEPKPSEQAGVAGSGFSININFTGQKPGPRLVNGRD